MIDCTFPNRWTRRRRWTLRPLKRRTYVDSHAGGERLHGKTASTRLVLGGARTTHHQTRLGRRPHDAPNGDRHAAEILRARLSMILRLVDQPLAETHKDHVQWTPRSNQAHALAAERHRFRFRLRLSAIWLSARRMLSAIIGTVPSQKSRPQHLEEARNWLSRRWTRRPSRKRQFFSTTSTS